MDDPEYYDPISGHPLNSMDSSSSTFIASPKSAGSVHQRQAYHRIPTPEEEKDVSYHGAGPEENSEDTGLRIQNMQGTAQGPSIEISYSEESTPHVPGSASFMLSPTLSRSGKKIYKALQGTPEEDMPGHFHSARPRSDSSLYKSFEADSENHTLRRVRTSTSSLSPNGPIDGKHQEFTCTTKQHFHHPRGDFASILVLMASAFSTIFSGIWLGLAAGKPHYGQMITRDSKLPPSTASLLAAAFAKSIELTFVTTFVAFLGQILSQKAFRKNSQGITVAQMQMRTWILQPGTIFTHSAAVRYAALTILGSIALFAALLAMIYTTASDALVSPKLRYGDIQDKMLYGKVLAAFANQTYIQGHCATPIPLVMDPDHSGQTCIAIEHNGQAFHNYAQYLTDWTKALDHGDVSTDLAKRPLPVGSLYDNTTVQGSWIDLVDMKDNSAAFKRVVNNVSLAMPHANVFAAANDPRNSILQPQDLDGLGEYQLEASVPSPAINVLCAEMTKDELAPIVVHEWPAYNTKPFNASAWPAGFDIPNYPSWINSTVVDGIFGFGKEYGRRPPVFAKLPKVYNTILNYTSFPINDSSIYLLTTSEDSRYMMCSLRASLSPECSTQMHVTMSGGSIKTRCEDPHNRLMYSKSQPSATSGVYSELWRDVAAQWALALSLNAGTNDADASNARLLSQLMPREASLDPKLPSIAEALAVLAGCTLLLGSFDTPLLHYWNYTEDHTLMEPAYQAFNASLKVQDYSSGGTQQWQNIFYIVLTSVFLINVFCLGYFITHTGMVTDYMEPQNLFALSLNSPPSQVLEGTCGGGPEGEQWRSTWHIWMNRREHFHIESTDDPTTKRGGKLGGGPQRGTVEGIEMNAGGKSPAGIGQMYERMSTKRGSWL